MRCPNESKMPKNLSPIFCSQSIENATFCAVVRAIYRIIQQFKTEYFRLDCRLNDVLFHGTSGMAFLFVFLSEYIQMNSIFLHSLKLISLVNFK